MTATLQLEVITVAGSILIERVVSVRFDADDGSRGVRPGHEPARCVVLPGAVEIRVAGEGASRFVATEEAMAFIEPGAVRLVTPWASQAESLDALHQAVMQRGVFRAQMEVEARAMVHRHEVATRRALLALRRDVHG